jgi:hypothetical protein
MESIPLTQQPVSHASAMANSRIPPKRILEVVEDPRWLLERLFGT